MLDKIQSAWAEAIYSDLENGVRSLNERVHKEFASRYPSIASFGDTVDGLFKRVRHKKRGSEYAVIGHGKIQTDVPLKDYDEVVVYQSEDGTIWVRPVSEFMDGRFENVENG
jgi:hypothetical protein